MVGAPCQADGLGCVLALTDRHSWFLHWFCWTPPAHCTLTTHHSNCQLGSHSTQASCVVRGWGQGTGAFSAKCAEQPNQEARALALARSSSAASRRLRAKLCSIQHQDYSTEHPKLMEHPKFYVSLLQTHAPENKNGVKNMSKEGEVEAKNSLITETVH